MWFSVASCTLIIFLFWLAIKPDNYDNKKNDDNGEIKAFKEKFKEKTKGLSFDNISSEISKFTKDISGEMSKEKEVKVNEIPRLPMEIE